MKGRLFTRRERQQASLRLPMKHNAIVRLIGVWWQPSSVLLHKFLVQQPYAVQLLHPLIGTTLKSQNQQEQQL
jgi:hypothetical protein